MRVTFWTYRTAVRHPQQGLPGDIGGFASTTSIRQKAVRVYHREGPDAARRALESGLGGYFARPGGPSTQAANTRASFERYNALAGRDPRRMALLDLTTDVDLGSHQVGVRVDVTLFESLGYTGRILLWDTEELTRDLAEIFAAPCVRAIDQILGDGTCQTIEVWQLRQPEEHIILRSDALGALSGATERLRVAIA